MKQLYTYILGFTLSLALTLVAFGLVQEHVASSHEFFPHEVAVPTLIALAVIQLFVQVTCFLHVGRGKHASWNTVVLSLAMFVVVVIVGGSIWIMGHLDHQSHTVEELLEAEAVTPYAR